MWCNALRCIMILTLSLLAVPLAADAQPPAHVARLGLLSVSLSSASILSHPTYKAFLQGLGALGYVEGKHVVMESRGAEGHIDRLPDLAAELVRLKVAIIFTVGAEALQAAKNATRTIPIVFTSVGDPVQRGFVASLAQPGGNITGLANLGGTALEGKRLELLKEAMPGITHIAVLGNPPNRSYAQALNELEGPAQAVGVQLQPLEVQNADDLDSAFVAMGRGHADALTVIGSGFTSRHLSRIADLALKGRLPAIAWSRAFAEVGGLMAYGVNEADVARRVATYVDKILKGTPPADLPVEQPMKFELVINLKTAKALGLTIPPTLLFQADEVIR
jgi:putative ABC transport system substrate-binding protein